MMLDITGAPQPDPDGHSVKLFNEFCADKDMKKDGLLLS